GDEVVEPPLGRELVLLDRERAAEAVRLPQPAALAEDRLRGRRHLVADLEDQALLGLGGALRAEVELGIHRVERDVLDEPALRRRALPLGELLAGLVERLEEVRDVGRARVVAELPRPARELEPDLLRPEPELVLLVRRSEDPVPLARDLGLAAVAALA